MIRRNSKFPDGSTMLLGRITLFAFPIVLWVFFCQRIHIIITIGLGKDACCSNCQILAVAFYDGCIRQILIGFETVAIHDNCFRTNLELVQGSVHSQDTGVEDIDFIDFFGSNNAQQGIVINRTDGVKLENIKVSAKTHTFDAKNSKNVTVNDKTYKKIDEKGITLDF